MTFSPQIKDLPHNFEAEQCVLGAILVNNQAYHRVSDFLKPEHFADPMHAELFRSCGNVINRGQQASPFTLKAYVDSTPGLKEQGGLRYLAQLGAASVHVGDAESYAKTVRDAAIRRSLIAIGAEVTNDAHKPSSDETAAQQIERAERRLYDLAQGNTDGGFSAFARDLESAVTQAGAAHKRQGQLSGVTTGLRSLDKLLGGLHPSDLVIIAGRPSMGKTALATNIATAAAFAYRQEPDGNGEMHTIDGARVGFFSLEMSAEQLAIRIVSDRARISSDRVRKGNLTAPEFDRFLNAAKQLEEMPLYIDDTPALSISALRTRARRLQRQKGLELIVVDYLQLIRTDERRRNDNRVQEVSEVTMGLKALAKELNVPVLALSQLSRNVENRTDKRPQLSDLRDSGSIEQDADVVMFVFREAYYLERQGLDVPAELADRAEILVEKQRHGPIGMLKMKFEAWLTRFSDLEPT